MNDAFKDRLREVLISLWKRKENYTSDDRDSQSGRDDRPNRAASPASARATQKKSVTVKLFTVTLFQDYHCEVLRSAEKCSLVLPLSRRKSPETRVPSSCTTSNQIDSRAEPCTLSESRYHRSGQLSRLRSRARETSCHLVACHFFPVAY